MRRLAGLIVATFAMLLAASTRAQTVGFQQLTIVDGVQRPLVIGIWYPSVSAARQRPIGPFVQDVALDGKVAGERLPLVVMSHGTGGWFGEHYDTALALARAGFVVAALNHPGDTYDDQTRAVRLWERPEQLRRLTDYMLSEWSDHARIDADRIGAFGFSAGGFTVLAAIGGMPDLSLVTPHCAAHPHGFECALLKRSGPFILPDRSVWVRDARIKAAVVAAPALGYVFDLRGVTVPIQLWRAQDDHILPNPDYAEAVRWALPKPPEYRVVPNADHFDFLAPCSDTLRGSVPAICDERPGFDRVHFHADLDQAVVAFFQRALAQR